MARVFSWKVSSGKYAYIIPATDGSYVRNKITAESELRNMSTSAATLMETEYAQNFNLLKAEVETYGKSIIGDYQKYYDVVDTSETTKVVLLTGQDGEGRTNSPLLTESDYQAFNNMVDSALTSQRQYVDSAIANVSSYVASDVTAQVAESLAEIDNAVTAATAARQDAEAAMESADRALEIASTFTDLSDSGITSQDIVNAISQTDLAGEWIRTNDPSISAITADYNETKEYIGLTGSTYDPSQGVFHTIYANVNVVSGTVGTITQSVDAMNGRMDTVMQYYSSANTSIGELQEFKDASQGSIMELANYIDSGTNNSIYEHVNAQAAEIVTSAQSVTSGAIVTLEQNLNALSGTVKTEVNRLDVTSSALTTAIQEMDTLSGSVLTSLTELNEVSGTAVDLRDSWTISSGMVRSVSKMVGGYQYTGGTDPIVVYPTVDDPNTYTDVNGNVYTTDVEAVFAPESQTFVNQSISAITLAASFSGVVKSAIELEAGPDNSKIYLGADKILMDGDVIAESLSAKSADIGDVYIGEGAISASTYTLNATGLTANNAQITGTISASTIIGSSMSAGTICGSTIIGSEMSASTICGATIVGSEISGATLRGATVIGVEMSAATFCGSTIVGSHMSAGDISIGEGDSIFVVNDDGTMSATSAYFSGEINADAGKIGGFIIDSDKLTARNLDDDKTSVLLNADGPYSSATYGKVFLATGILTEGDDTLQLYWYKVTQNITQDLPESVCTREFYGPASGTMSGTKVIAYDYDEQDGSVDPESEREFIYSATTDAYESSTNGMLYTQISDTGGTPIYITYTFQDKITVTASDAILFSDTLIFEDGTLMATKLKANGADIKGTIHADKNSEFEGVLTNARGNLTEAVIKNSKMDSTEFAINNRGRIYGYTSAGTYFTASSDNVSSGTSITKRTVSSIDWSKTNSDTSSHSYDNGTGKTVLTVDLEAGSILTIPAIKCYARIYIPDGTSISTSRRPKCSIAYIVTQKEYPYTTTTTYIKDYGLFGTQSGSISSHGNVKWNGTTIATTYTANTSCTVSIVIKWDILVPKATWAGADKATATITFTPQAMAEINNPNAKNGFYIGPNGFIYKGTNSMIYGIGDNLTMKSGTYGIRITPNGITTTTAPSNWTVGQIN